MNVLAEMTWKHYTITTLIVIVCLLLMVIILLQKGRGGGLASAFGGGGGSSAFGAKTGDVFTWATVAFAGAFLLLIIFANFIFRPDVIAVTPTPSISPAGPIDIPAPTAPIQTSTTSPVGETRIPPTPVTAAPSDPAPATPESAEPAPTAETESESAETPQDAPPNP
jgi:preprotein translocase subunit SecG